MLNLPIEDLLGDMSGGRNQGTSSSAGRMGRQGGNRESLDGGLAQEEHGAYLPDSGEGPPDAQPDGQRPNEDHQVTDEVIQPRDLQGANQNNGLRRRRPINDEN